MKKERIMINGIKYRYIINDSNEIETSKPVSKEVFESLSELSEQVDFAAESMTFPL